MTIVVGYAPDAHGRGALNLAAMLARSSGEGLIVCSVIPEPWFPSMAKVDAEYREVLHQQADEALRQARRVLPDDITADFVRHESRSAPAGLLEVADERDALMIVADSSGAGAFGHVALGSVTDRLMHSASLPVAVATRGFRAKAGSTVHRVTVAYGGAGDADVLAVAVGRVAARLGASLRLAAFAVWSRPSYTMRLGAEGEDPVLAGWLADIRTAASGALDNIEDLPRVPRDLESVVGIGDTWEQALDDIDWADGDVLAVGSSGTGPLARIFLGSRGTKIIRNSPVPVLAMPRGATEVIAAEVIVEAERG